MSQLNRLILRLRPMVALKEQLLEMPAPAWIPPAAKIGTPAPTFPLGE
ncbi:MAG: hypothetical protein ACR2OX_08450 [Methyloligellaceae bacterium]